MVQQPARVVLPHHQQRRVVDEGGEVVLLAAGQVRHGAQDLHRLAVGHGHRGGVVAAEEELDDARVQGHGALVSVSTRSEREGSRAGDVPAR